MSLSNTARGGAAISLGAVQFGESAGLEAAALGFWEIAKDDFEDMKIQFPAYDALYRYCQLKVQGKAKLKHATR